MKKDKSLNQDFHDYRITGIFFNHGNPENPINRGSEFFKKTLIFPKEVFINI